MLYEIIQDMEESAHSIISFLVLNLKLPFSFLPEWTMNEQKKLERALSSFLQDYAGSLARILGTAVKKGRISYEEIEKLIEPAWAGIPGLVEMLGEYAEGRHVTAIQIKQASKALDLEDRVDSLIADLKACGILSPALGYLPEAAKKRTPVYELNPSLFPVQ